MKTVKRRGVFETNSSSTHTLTLISVRDFKDDKERYQGKGIIFSKEDKLLMACGCCHELFVEEKQMAAYASWEGDDQEYQIERKQGYDEVKNAIAEGRGDEIPMCHYTVYYEVAMSLLVRVYCELTGEDYDKTYKRVDKKNHSGRACHMKFFSEGALDDERMDYMLIDDLFDGTETEVLNAIRRYFSDDFALLYREYYAGIGMYDD